MAVDGINNLDSSYYTSSDSQVKNDTTANSKSVVGKDDFLQLLIAQLQNQDPLNPVDNQDFSVNLAQFSQLEQLISINGAMEKFSGNGNSESLASYLGHQVLLNDKTINVSNGQGGDIVFKLPENASDVRVDLLDDANNIVETLSLGELEKGDYTATLENIVSGAGSYEARLSYLNSQGFYSTIDFARAGIVSGFIPGGETPLLIGDTQIALSDIKEVRI
ncbi:MAG: flagellar hook assembly protein FlgD [Bdellovibrionota bacterium]|jgi:flagellar basal-body rod modification protein FlgD